MAKLMPRKRGPSITGKERSLAEMTLPRLAYEEAAKTRRIGPRCAPSTVAARPRIGINCDLGERGNPFGPLIVLPTEFFSCLAAAEVLLLSPFMTFDDVAALGLDGLVLIGGLDLDPRNDGFQLHSAHRLMHPLRERFDRALVAWAREKEIPTLGIGAGMQTIAVVCGGELAYHIPIDYPKSKYVHAQAGDWDHGHPVMLDAGSFCSLIAADTLVAHVRSQHHQCVEVLPEGFAATARAMDGMIEAIETTFVDQQRWIAIGAQWHPEFPTAHATDRLLFDYFCAICADQRLTRRKK